MSKTQKARRRFSLVLAAHTRLYRTGRCYVANGQVAEWLADILRDDDEAFDCRWSPRGGWWFRLDEEAVWDANGAVLRRSLPVGG